jgi:hypothetical protein
VQRSIHGNFLIRNARQASFFVFLSASLTIDHDQGAHQFVLHNPQSLIILIAQGLNTAIQNEIPDRRLTKI